MRGTRTRGRGLARQLSRARPATDPASPPLTPAPLPLPPPPASHRSHNIWHTWDEGIMGAWQTLREQGELPLARVGADGTYTCAPARLVGWGGAHARMPVSCCGVAAPRQQPRRERCLSTAPTHPHPPPAAAGCAARSPKAFGMAAPARTHPYQHTNTRARPHTPHSHALPTRPPACLPGLVPKGARCDPETDAWCQEGAVVSVPKARPPLLLVYTGEGRAELTGRARFGGREGGGVVV